MTPDQRKKAVPRVCIIGGKVGDLDAWVVTTSTTFRLELKQANHGIALKLIC